jgi:hypothetical protein
MSLVSSRITSGYTKTYDDMQYLDLSRYSGYKKTNIDYTIVSNNQALVGPPVFNANKIIKGTKVLAYSDDQNEFKPDELNNLPIGKEYRKLR